MEYDILLLNITRSTYQVSSGFRDNLGLHSIASYLSQNDFKAKVLSAFSYNSKEIIQNEILKNGIKIIGFYTACDNLSVVINIIKWLKKSFDVTIIVGGPQSVALKEEFLRTTKCDFVSEGEGEETTKELLSYLIDGIGSLEIIKNIRYIDTKNKYCENELREPIQDLDSISFPNPENSLNSNFRKGEQVGIITGRGCPNHCSFCYEGANAKSVRFRSIKNVFEEIDYIKANNSSLKYINVYDDTFTLNYKRVVEFCKEMKKRDLMWFCEGHINNIYNMGDMIEIMVDSGLVSMQIGLESGSDKVLNAYNKNTTAETIYKVVEKCKKAGLCNLSGNFIIGGALEDEGTIQESMDLAANLIEVGRGMFECRTVFLAPYPKTAIEMHPEKFDLKIHENLNKKVVSTMRSAVISSKKMSIDQIVNSKKKFDIYLEEQYKKQALLSSKNEINSCFFYRDTPISLNSRWIQAYRSEVHIENFIQNAFRVSNIENIEDLYPIRTFEILEYEKESLICGAYKFDGIKREFLENSAGTYNIKELSKVLYADLETIINIYNELNNLCLVYLTDF